MSPQLGSAKDAPLAWDSPPKQVALRYGCNPHQAEAAFEARGAVRIRAGAPSFVNMLDALNAWQLVRELKEALAMPAAASFKHVSPAGAAVAVALTEDSQHAYEVSGRTLTPLATAYVRARGTDPMSSFGDFVALSDPVDAATAAYLQGVVSDGVVAPGFEDGALEVLAHKKRGAFVVIEVNPDYEPPPLESREVFGVALTQTRNDRRITERDIKHVVCGTLSIEAMRDLVLGLITLKYTQSNSVVLVTQGQTTGVGAGQQSRVDCTKLAGAKSDIWHLRHHPKVRGLRFRADVKRQQRINWRVRCIEGDLTATEQAALSTALETPPPTLTDDERSDWIARHATVALASDGFIPFRDNVDHAQRHGVRSIAQPGGSARDDEVKAACEEYGIAMAHTGLRLFHH